MKSIIVFVVVIVLLINFSESIFGFNAKETLKTDGIWGTTTRLVCGSGGCK